MLDDSRDWPSGNGGRAFWLVLYLLCLTLPGLFIGRKAAEFRDRDRGIGERTPVLTSAPPLAARWGR